MVNCAWSGVLSYFSFFSWIPFPRDVAKIAGIKEEIGSVCLHESVTDAFMAIIEVSLTKAQTMENGLRILGEGYLCFLLVSLITTMKRYSCYTVLENFWKRIKRQHKRHLERWQTSEKLAPLFNEVASEVESIKNPVTTVSRKTKWINSVCNSQLACESFPSTRNALRSFCGVHALLTENCVWFNPFSVDLSRCHG